MVKDQMLSLNSNILVITGDVFSFREQTFAYLNRVMEVLQEFKDVGISVYTIVGNHDLSYDRSDSIINHPLGLMFKSGLIKHLKTLDLATLAGYTVRLRGFDYPDNLEAAVSEAGMINICVMHRFYNTPQDFYSISPKEVINLNYLVYILGHDHISYPNENVSGHIVIRPGAMMRGTSHGWNLAKDVIITTIEFGGLKDKPQLSYIDTKLDIKPADEVFSAAVFRKDSSLASLVADLNDQVGFLIEEMDSVSVDSSVYEFLDAMPSLKPAVKVRIETVLSEKGILRPAPMVASLES
jgi:predicted phosphodiesterase